VVGAAAALLLVISNLLLGRSVSADLLGEVRIPVWQSTLHLIRDRPWLGVGLDGYRYVYPRYMLPQAWREPLLYHPHNVWLDAAARLGVPGLALFVLLVSLCVRQVRGWRRGATGLERALAAGCMAGLLAGLAHGMVDSGYFLADLAWSLGLVSAIACKERAFVSDGAPTMGDRRRSLL
jgi:putative inorganic carbon (HCO3(-)) transporter